MANPIPDRVGFWWGLWRIAEDDTYEHQPGVSAAERDRPPSMEWEVMHVVDNNDDEHPLMVMVPGVAAWQPIENFVWGDFVGPEREDKSRKIMAGFDAAIDAIKRA